MSTLQQEPHDRAVVGKIKEVLEQRIGSDRFGLWFNDRVRFCFEADQLLVLVDGEFALERLRGNYLRAVESAASEVLNRLVVVRLMLQTAKTDMLAFTASSQKLGNLASDADTQVVAGAGKANQCGDHRAGKISNSIPRGVVSVQQESLSPQETTSAGQESVARRGDLVEKQSRYGVDRGPGQLSQWLMAAATDPRHSDRQPNVNKTLVRSSMPARSQPNELHSDPAVKRCSVGNTPLANSIRVTAEPPRTVGSLDSLPQGENGASVDFSGAGQPAGERRRVARPISNNGAAGAKTQAGGNQSRDDESMTFANFVNATSNTLATTAARMLATDPRGSTPLCFWGATGTGKTHLLSAIRHELRARHRMPRVLLMSAEDFTNDFLSCVRGTGLPAFRKRYRDVDALLIDNVQFLGGKNATLREMLYTVDTILSRRRPLVLAADRQPLEIEGLSADLAGRMSSGLVCGINPMELDLRRELFRRYAVQSYMPWDDETIEMLAQRAVGDGRVIQGISQLVSMLQRMYRRMPTAQEITSHAGDLLQRGPKVVALADVEKAICTAFGLSANELRSDSKSRNVSQPRILAMYLSRQHTTAAFSEIGRYYGDRNHSTVIAAHRRVEDWLKLGQSVGGRGPKNMKVQEAIAAVENLLRIG